MADYGVPSVICSVTERSTKSYSEKIDGPLPPFTLLPDKQKGDKWCYYGVRVVTGQREGAGVGNIDMCGIRVQLVGNKARSGVVNVGDALQFTKPFGQGTYDDFIIECADDLGAVLVTEVGNNMSWLGPKGSPWFVDYMAVKSFATGQDDMFPCYHWIGDGDAVSCTVKTNTWKNIQSDDILTWQWKMQLAKRKQQYQWQQFPSSGLPACISTEVKELPIDEQFERVKEIDFTKNTVAAVATLSIKGYLTCFESLNDYERLATAMQKPDLPLYEIGRWSTDREFGRQMLNGINPVVIRRCTAIPEHFPVTNELVQGFLSPRLTLDEEMQAGKVYICDLTIMDGLKTKEGYYTCAPTCLLYVDGAKCLVPIAIQLKKQPGEDNPIFLPSDNLIDWVLAKIYYQNANTQFHQLSTHYLSCHAAMEAYGMATMRTLPDSHPVLKLLHPHFRYTMAINTQARQSLINPGGTIDKIFSIGGEGKEDLFSRASEAYRVQLTNVKHSIKERGVDDPDKLPQYHYRDDGVKVWEALEEYVRNVIGVFYLSDGEVASDPQLQEWAKEIHTKGFPAFRSAPEGRGFPNKVENREVLIEYCTLIMFTGSAQHASINFGQYDYVSYVPNSPAALRRPPPNVKGASDYKTLLDALPDAESAALSVAIVHALSQFSPDEIYLGQIPTQLFSEPDVQRIMRRFSNRLNVISEEIKERNKLLDVPYTYLLPERIPNSITI